MLSRVNSTCVSNSRASTPDEQSLSGCACTASLRHSPRTLSGATCVVLCFPKLIFDLNERVVRRHVSTGVTSVQDYVTKICVSLAHFARMPLRRAAREKGRTELPTQEAVLLRQLQRGARRHRYLHTPGRTAVMTSDSPSDSPGGNGV